MNYILMNFSVILSKIENILQKLILWFKKSQYTLLTYNSFNLKPLPRANLHIDSTASNTLFASWPISSMIRSCTSVVTFPQVHEASPECTEDPFSYTSGRAVFTVTAAFFYRDIKFSETLYNNIISFAIHVFKWTSFE